ncbi:unnamed protein product [Caenorhabditis auriculariae]|uniref:C2 NT-type domain-containing protein n=1 Tax=Caenorhabditis auriculariae TaxID=2777116 RepID=A0A8S1HSR7_9PELO|nr:unnamed protein product [Caenorhabditis auriculariae]
MHKTGVTPVAPLISSAFSRRFSHLARVSACLDTTMAGMLRRLRRSSKKAARFRFTVTLQELLLVADDVWKPETIVVSFLHRRRKISSKERKWEQSFSNSSQCVIVWPEIAADTLDVVTTLYKTSNDDQFDDKEWTIVVEEVNAKGKRKAIAAVPLNVRLFILDLPEHHSELKLKLRPLNPHLKQCSLVILLASQMLKEGLADEISRASSISSVDRTPREITVPDAARVENAQNSVAAREITEISSSIQQWRSAEPDHRSLEPQQKKVEVEEKAPPVPKHAERPPEEAPSKVRPPWRVSVEKQPEPENEKENEKEKEKERVGARISRASVEDRPATNIVFEVDEKNRMLSRFQQLFLARIRCLGAFIQDPTPHEHPPGSPLQNPLMENLCSNGHRGKSWRTGLALCAIVHSYRSDLIPDYESLDFSDTFNGRKSNVKKALNGFLRMGISDIPDEDEILTPNSSKIKHLLEHFRRIVEGAMAGSTPASNSDHRISQLYNISESEMKVLDEIKKLREQNELEGAVDYTNVEEESQPLPESFSTPTTKVTTVVSSSKTSTLPRDPFDDEEGNEKSNLSFGRQNVSITMVTPGISNLRASGRNASPAKQDELRRQAKAMIEKASGTPSVSKEVDEEKLKEARRLLDQAVTDGATFKISSNKASTTPLNSNYSRSGSSTDLRRVELVRPSVDVHRFKKRDPSPILARKRYDPDQSPIIPAIGRNLTNGNGRTAPEEVSALDRVKRYGSMRSSELRESLAQFAKQYGINDALGYPTSDSATATPTRKIKSQWEKDVEDVEGTTKEQERIEERLQDVEEQAAAINRKCNEAEKGSSEEQTLLETFIELTNEKNNLVGRQEYYNIIENIRQTEQRIKDLKAQVDEVTRTDDEYQKTYDEKARTDKLIQEYKGAWAEKDALVQKLFATEENLREDEERLKNLTLERASRFVRGIDQPVSASKRLMQWWKR